MGTFKRVAIGMAVGVAAGAWVAVSLLTDGDPDIAPFVEHVVPLIDRDAVISSLRETPQMVGMTGDVEKSITFIDDKWFGDRSYTMTLHGEFKLGIDTKDIEITTEGNTVNVKFPQPKLISVDLPFDKAEIAEDISWLRSDLADAEVQSLYSQARESAIEEIKVNFKAREIAEEALEDTIEGIIEQLPNVERVEFNGR